ncbi:hypothetical protein M0R04_14110 [Candidatus Dojkabacteria bacterium]|jgi:hypothetical protein|nr:hypothetical protein [Candidatus Dojkabacteria bacterium]
MLTIQQELGIIKSNYDKTIDLVQGLPFSQKRQIKTIEFYSNSKYLNGQLDELGREKPFMQILNAICDVENSAKDLDTKDIKVDADDGNHYLESFLLSKDIQVWMKEADFAKTLNDMRDIHTRYGSLLVKKCIERDENGEKILKLELPEWKNTLTDQVNIIQGAIVETHWMTAVELSKMTEWKNLDQVMEKLKGGGSSKRIPVYEIRGEFSKATFKNANGEKYSTKDEKEFSYQLYYVAGNPVESGKEDNIEAFVTLYSEDDTERVYKYLARKPRAGRSFGVGVFEEGEEAQVWTNDTVLKQYRAMEYTTKVIGQSASKKLKGRNLLTETDDGTILEHEDNKPITALNLLPSGGLTQYSNLIQQWYNQLEKTTSAYSAQRGDTPPSGTPFRLQATVLQQSSSVFKTLQQEMGIFITEIFEDWIMPYLATKLNKEHILSYDFSPEELKEIDKNFSTRNANDQAKEKILSGQIVTPEEYEVWVNGADEFIKQTKGKRFIVIPKNFYKNLEAKVTINVTGEQRNKAATLESLTNILMTVSGNPALTQDPVLSQVLMKILELSGAGISPVNISSAISEKNKAQEKLQAEQAMTGQPETMSLSAKAPMTV